MGNVQHKGSEEGLSRFQRRKLRYDFYTFFDLNNDGCLTYNDFLWAKDKICFMSGWKIDSPKYKITEALFNEIWESLEHIADIDKDGKITKAEWLAMWTVYKKEIMAREKEEKDFLKNYYQRNKALHDDEHGKAQTKKEDGDEGDNSTNGISLEQQDSEDWPVELDSDEEAPEGMRSNNKGTNAAAADKKSNKEEEEKEKTVLEQFASHETKVDDSMLPKWLYKYLVFRFNLLDRTGDSLIDNEEFEYVLSEFGVSEKTARQAFTIFTQNNTVPLTFDLFVHLFEEYYLSDDPSALGNFINGKLSYDEEESEDEDPGLLDHHDHHKSSTSIHSMDDDLNQPPEKEKKEREKRRSTIKLHEMKEEVKQKCCVVS